MTNSLPDNLRITRFGKFFRTTSIDELPQFIIVLKGDMSFVESRPLLMEYLNLYNHEQRRRHDVRSGITELAQINGSNAITWKKNLTKVYKYPVEVSLSLGLTYSA